MSNNVRILYKEIYRNDRSLPVLIINTTSIIPAQLLNYPLYFILIIYLKPHNHTIKK